MISKAEIADGGRKLLKQPVTWLAGGALWLFVTTGDVLGLVAFVVKHAATPEGRASLFAFAVAAFFLAAARVGHREKERAAELRDVYDAVEERASGKYKALVADGDATARRVARMLVKQRGLERLAAVGVELEMVNRQIEAFLETYAKRSKDLNMFWEYDGHATFNPHWRALAETNELLQSLPDIPRFRLTKPAEDLWDRAGEGEAWAAEVANQRPLADFRRYRYSRKNDLPLVEQAMRSLRASIADDLLDFDRKVDRLVG